MFDSNLFLFLILILTIACRLNYQKKYIFYLHGRIIEIQGKNAVSEEFGAYEFDNIINELKLENAEIIAEVRNENVDYFEYSTKVSKQIDSLFKSKT